MAVLFNHRSVAITNTPAPLLSADERKTSQYLLVRAAFTNTQIIYLGNSTSVNGTNGDANCGFPLRPGEVKEFPINESLDGADERNVYGFAPSGTQYAHTECK